jgi:Na+-driven multidrug efflux pump
MPGSALGTALARGIECALMLTLTYTRDSVAASSLRAMFSFDRAFLASVLKTVIPVTFNEILWSLGVSTYNLIFGRIGTEAVAAVSIAGTIENLAFVPFVGMANAAAIMIGHRIGADEEHAGFEYAKRFLRITIILGMIVGSVIFLSADWILTIYKIDATTRGFARNVLTIIAFALWIKSSNMMFIVGILRAGGDARVCFLIDVGSIWLVGIPIASAGAFVLGLPVYWVYALTIADELAKFIVSAWRVISKKWITNLARRHQA